MKPTLPICHSLQKLPNMSGRSRGRARGRSRSAAPLESRRPGEQPAQAVSSEQQVGRGGRGRPVSQTAAAAQKQPPPQPQTMQPPVQQMARMEIIKEPSPKPPEPAPPLKEPSPKPKPKEPTPPATGASVGRSTGRGYYSEPVTRPEHILDKRGNSGVAINVMSNFVALKNRPNCALYQYNVSYSPPVENKRLRLKLVYEQETLIGKTRAFDGMILYLPKRLPDDVTEYTSKLKDESLVKVTITLTNELNANSPICIQLFNIIFRR